MALRIGESGSVTLKAVMIGGDRPVAARAARDAARAS